MAKTNGKKLSEQTEQNLEALVREESLVQSGLEINRSPINPRNNAKQLYALEEQTSPSALGVNEEEKKVSIKKVILGDRILLRNLILMMILFSASSFSYYLISYQLKYLKGDIFVNVIVSALSEMAGYLISGK